MEEVEGQEVARMQKQKKGALSTGAGQGAARQGRHVPGSPALRASHRPFRALLPRRAAPRRTHPGA